MAVIVGAAGPEPLAARLTSAAQRPGGASGRPHGRRRSSSWRWWASPWWRCATSTVPPWGRSRASRGRSSSSSACSALDVPAPAHALRALRLRHRWQPRGGPSCRHQGASIRTWAFVLCSFTAGIAGLLYASYLGGMSNNVNGGQLVLYAVAAAVIGGTSLFGGTGQGGPRRPRRAGDRRHLQRHVPPRAGGAVGVHRHRLVLIGAVTIDALSRRGSSAGTIVR